MGNFNRSFIEIVLFAILAAALLMPACTPAGVAPIQNPRPPTEETPVTPTPTTPEAASTKTPGSTPTPTTPNTGTTSTTPGVPGDGISPYLSGLSPASGAKDVPRGDTRILAHVKDDGAGVDATSIIMTVAGERVTPQISGTAADYAVAFVPQAAFKLGQTIQVTVEARDLASNPNSMSTATWSFTLASNPTPGAYTVIDDLGLTGAPPDSVDIEKYRLKITGLVDNPLELTYAEVLAYPAISGTPQLECVGFFLDKAEWTGVPITILLDQAGVKPEAGQAIFHAIDGYRLPLNLDIVRGDGVYLAYMVNGQVLPLKHGYPLRVVVSDASGFNWTKWVEKIELVP